MKMKQHMPMATSICLIGILTVGLFFSSYVTAAEMNTITNKVKIERLLKTIPSNDKKMPYKSLGERLPNLGLVVSSVIFGNLQPDEIQTSQGLYKKGDILFQFSTNEPNEVVKAICPIARVFSLIKRGSRWLPDDRTSNFLLNGYTCTAP